MKKKRTNYNKYIQSMQHVFYVDVYDYIIAEYSPRVVKLFTDSPIAGDIVDLINDYYWGGNSVPFVAGQIVDLLKSKYKKQK